MKKMINMNRRGIQKSGREPGEGPLTEPAGGWQRPLNRGRMGAHTHISLGGIAPAFGQLVLK